MCMRLYVALCILIGTCVRCPIKPAPLYRSPLKRLPFSPLRLMRLFSPWGVGISSTCIWPSALLSNVNVSATTRDGGGKHVERLSESRSPPDVSILGLWSTSHCFQSNHLWSWGRGGGGYLWKYSWGKLHKGEFLQLEACKPGTVGRMAKMTNSKLPCSERVECGLLSDNITADLI